MGDEQLPFDEEAVVLRVEHGLLDVLASEALIASGGLPEARGQELGAIAVVTPEDVEAPVAGVAREARPPVSSTYSRSSASSRLVQPRQVRAITGAFNASSGDVFLLISAPASV